MAEGDASFGGNADLGEIDLTWTDKLRKMVSSDAEWEAIILKKMEEKRNRGDFPFSLRGPLCRRARGSRLRPARIAVRLGGKGWSCGAAVVQVPLYFF